MENKTHQISRRQFLGSLGVATGALCFTPQNLFAAGKRAKKGGKGFVMWQIPSHEDTIGNSYVFLTNGGKVIVMDGGHDVEANTLRGFIGALGNEVEAWFISHPHEDHMGALDAILRDQQDLVIKNIYHSRISEEVRLSEEGSAEHCKSYYESLDNASDHINVVDIRQPGGEYVFDDMHLRILSVTLDDLKHPSFNNCSMIMRVWDKAGQSFSLVMPRSNVASESSTGLSGISSTATTCRWLIMVRADVQKSSTMPFNSVHAFGLRLHGCGIPLATG